MSILIKLFIEEEEKQLNIIIWNDENGQIKFADKLSSPVANLKIPLNVRSAGGHAVGGNSWKEFTVSNLLNGDSGNQGKSGETTSESQSAPNKMVNNKNEEQARQNECRGFVKEHLSLSKKDCGREVDGESIAQIFIEPNQKSKNKMTDNPISEKNKTADENEETENSGESDDESQKNTSMDCVKNAEKQEKSIINTIENLDNPFAINKFLLRLKKKCGAVGNVKQNSSVCEAHKKTSSNANNVVSTETKLNYNIRNTVESIENNSSQLAGSSRNISTDRMSICSDNDYTLMIEDEPLEKETSTNKSALVPGNVIKNQERKLDTKVHSAPPTMKQKHSIHHCSFCDRDFKRAANHKRHMVNFHGLKFTCPICNAAFEFRTQFSLHLRNHCRYR